MKTWLKRKYWRYTSIPSITLESEFRQFRSHCRGIVLNVGAGVRALDLGPCHLKTDVDSTFPIHFTSDAHHLPLSDGSVDTVVSIAVLEHVRYPWKVLDEFYRVLSPGGKAIIAVPFLQPSHDRPHDFFRFTSEGIISTLELSGFQIVLSLKMYNPQRVLSWIAVDLFAGKSVMLRALILPVFHVFSMCGTDVGRFDSTVYRGVYVIAEKPGPRRVQVTCGAESDWYFPLLCCPVTKKRLFLKSSMLVSEDHCVQYPIIGGIPRLLPQERVV